METGLEQSAYPTSENGRRVSEAGKNETDRRRTSDAALIAGETHIGVTRFHFEAQRFYSRKVVGGMPTGGSERGISPAIAPGIGSGSLFERQAAVSIGRAGNIVESHTKRSFGALMEIGNEK